MDRLTHQGYQRYKMFIDDWRRHQAQIASGFVQERTRGDD